MTFSRHTVYSLLGIVAATALLWIGVAGIHLNCDDYQYIESLAPIQSVGDLFRSFVMTDFNPVWFRPFANLTMGFDFLLFHWSGGAYHVTNLLFHLLATASVFYFARRIFGLGAGLALLLAFAFGINASHEYNLTTDTARADILVSLFIMWALLCEYKAQREGATIWRAVGVVAYLFALFSKETAFFILPFIPLFTVDSLRKNWKKALRVIIPYAIVAVGFLILHSHYGASPKQNPWMSLLTIHGIVDDLYKNGMGAGYILLPVDFSMALVVLGQYKMELLVCAIFLFAIVATILWVYRHSPEVRAMFKPLVLLAITTLPITEFARWRFYLPSVALLAMAALFFSLVWKRGSVARVIVSFVLVLFGFFHIWQALSDQQDWRLATNWIETFHQQLVPILARESAEPDSICFVSLPAKCGDGVVLPIGDDALVKRCEADLSGPTVEKTGSVSGMQISAWTAVQVFSLDAQKGYSNLKVEQLGNLHYLVQAPNHGFIVLAPAALSYRGVSVLQTKFQNGDTIQSDKCLCTILDQENGKAYAIDVKLTTPNTLPIYFDGTTLRTFK